MLKIRSQSLVLEGSEYQLMELLETINAARDAGFEPTNAVSDLAFYIEYLLGLLPEENDNE